MNLLIRVSVLNEFIGRMQFASSRINEYDKNRFFNNNNDTSGWARINFSFSRFLC